LIKKETKRTQF